MGAAKLICILGIIVMVVINFVGSADGAGECPRSTPDREAVKLLPCAAAGRDPRAAVTKSCCAQVQMLGRNPKCLCAVMLSNAAKRSGVRPQVAITIPKRCGLARRPIGYKCGPYRLP